MSYYVAHYYVVPVLLRKQAWKRHGTLRCGRPSDSQHAHSTNAKTKTTFMWHNISTVNNSVELIDKVLHERQGQLYHSRERCPWGMKSSQHCLWHKQATKPAP